MTDNVPYFSCFFFLLVTGFYRVFVDVYLVFD